LKDPEKARRETFALAAVFTGSLLVWGMSMWVLKKSLKGPILQIVNDTARINSLDPWVQRANRHPVGYAEAAAPGSSASGRPVVWNVTGRTDAEAWFEGDPKRPIQWSNPSEVRTDPLQQAGRPYVVVAVIEKTGPKPRLRHLGGLRPSGLN
jgi:hypothetical protein